MIKVLPAFIDKIIKTYVYGEQPLHVRILNMLYLYGGFVAFVSLLMRIIEGGSFIPIIVTAVLVLLVAVLFFLNNHFKVFEIVSAVMCVFLGDVFLPIIFFTNGGLQSGVSAYFVFVAAVIFFTQRGKLRIVIILTYFAVVTSCFFIAYTYPHIVMPLNQFQYFIDNIQSFFLAGILIGGVLNFQRGLFENEQAKNIQAQKNRVRANELLNAINDSAVFLLTGTEKNFTGTMTKSIDILARCMEFDRVYIWKNIRDNAEAARYAVLYEWISGEQFKQGSLSLPAVELPPNWEERFFKGQHVGGPLSALSDRENKILRRTA